MVEALVFTAAAPDADMGDCDLLIRKVQKGTS